jgi:hypothetical protein
VNPALRLISVKASQLWKNQGIGTLLTYYLSIDCALARRLNISYRVKSEIMKTSLTILFTMILAVTGYSQHLTISQFAGESLSSHDTRLIWKTMMEMKVDYFNVQRSTDGTHFENVGQIDSKMTTTTNAYELNYDFTDASAIPGTSYYRLQIVDRNGFSNYSDVIQISNRQIEGIKIYPTVVNNTNLFVETDKPIRNAKLEFFDLSGKKIGETNWETLNGKQSLQPVSNMRAVATGTYLARLSSNGETVVNQLLIFQTH